MDDQTNPMMLAPEVQTPNPIPPPVQPPPPVMPPAKPARSMRVVWMVLIGIVVLAGAAYGWMKLNPSAPVALESASPSPSATVDATADWKTYTNTQYGFQVWHPSDLAMKDRILMSNYGQLADYWVGNATDELSVAVWNTSIYSYSQLQQPSGGAIDPDTVRQESLTIAGYPAIKFTQIAVSDTRGGVPMQKISILKDQLVYILECSGQYCDQILSTFKFTK